MGHHPLAQKSRKLPCQRISLWLGRLTRDRYVRMHAVLRFVDQYAILRRDLWNQHLPALLDHRLDVTQKETWHSSAKRLFQDLDLVGCRELGRIEKCPERLILAHRHCDGIEQRTPRLRLPAVSSSRQRQQRLGVVAADRRLVHPRFFSVGG